MSKPICSETLQQVSRSKSKSVCPGGNKPQVLSGPGIWVYVLWEVWQREQAKEGEEGVVHTLVLPRHGALQHSQVSQLRRNPSIQHNLVCNFVIY